MLNYELALIIRSMSRPEIVTTLKRTAEAIFNKGGIIRKIENLGTQDLPYKMTSHGMVHKQGSYFVLQFVVPPKTIAELKDEYIRDVDIIRPKIFRSEPPEEFECTLHEEMLPPAYRKDVQEIVKKSEKIDRYKFKSNSGLDYYPFQK
ncbi:hypothetical protein L9F63_015679 [Diploptera punctata]|uniref:Small ribosomal subunit protein bS6m n=1 Tax=Diploptera punctata TaxID=6984 RepID=A0AAD8EJW7_DIPPU|nr:hypothetical protein L9F63_015679 [Diploptera punctata]